MPIYEYRCTKCGHRFEAIQRVDDAPLSRCEKCKGKAERLISSPAIQFKGSGWYITDYARKGAGTKDASGPEGADGPKEKASEKKAKESGAGETSAGAEKPASKKKEKAGSTAK